MPFAIPDAKPSRRQALAYYREVARQWRLPLALHETVTAVRRAGDGFEVTSRRGEERRSWRAGAVALASGYFGKPIRLGVPGEDLPWVSARYQEPYGHFGDRVVVVGGGNSAAEAALELYRWHAAVTVVHRGTAFRPGVKYWLKTDREPIAEGRSRPTWRPRRAFVDGAVEVRTPQGRLSIPADAAYVLLGYLPELELARQVGVTLEPETLMPRVDPRPASATSPLLIAGTCRRRFTNRIFIENSRDHGRGSPLAGRAGAATRRWPASCSPPSAPPAARHTGRGGASHARDARSRYPTGTRRARRRSCRCVAALALLAVRAGARTGAERPARRLRRGLDVRVVNVEVVVTDKRALASTGCAPTSSPSRWRPGGPHRLLRRSGRRSRRRRPRRPAGAAAAPTAAEPGGPLGVSWLIFIDEFFAPARPHRCCRRSQGSSATSPVRPHGGGGVGRQAPHHALHLERLGARAGTRFAPRRKAGSGCRGSPSRSLVDDQRSRTRVAGCRGSTPTPPSRPDERQLVELLTSQVQRSVAAAAATLRAFAAPPGRKAMLLLAGGWPWRPIDSVVADPNRMITESSVGAEPLFLPLADVANLLGYTLYPVDVPGLSQRLVDVAASGPPSFAGTLAESRREQDLHLSLQWLAETTRAARSNDHRCGLRETVTTRSFYWLGFTPSAAATTSRTA